MTPIAERFLEALRTFDADGMTALLAPDAVAWRNLGNKDRTVEELADMLRLESRLISDSTLSVRHEAATTDGFVVQLDFAGTTRGGAAFHVPICIVARVDGDRITGFDEYADEASLQPLWQELASQSAPSA